MLSGDQQRDAHIVNLLGQGYGVEDISLLIYCPVSEVRDQVSLWRSQGMIRALWPKAKAPTARAEA